LGANIRKLRIKQGISQSQLSFETGLSREYINRVESGKCNISILNLQKISEILEVEMVVLLK